MHVDFWDGIRFHDSVDAHRGVLPVVLVHGLGTSLSFWSAVAPELGRTSRTVAFDVPGFGRSRDPRGGFDLAAIALDSLRFLEARDVGPAVVVGHSIGAVVALEMARRRPDLVQRLVLVSGTLIHASNLMRNPLDGILHPVAALSLAAQFAGGLVPMNEHLVCVLTGSELVRRLTLWPFAAAPAALDPHVLGPALLGDSGRSIFATLRALYDVDVAHLMEQVSQPVALVWGRQDRLLVPEDVEIAARLLDVSLLAPIDGSGHWPMLEQPEVLTRLIESQLAHG